MIQSIFFSLFVYLSIGLIFAILFISKEEIGRLYFIVTTLIALALICVALIANSFALIKFTQIFVFQATELNNFERFTYLLLILIIALLVIYNLIYPRMHKPILCIVFLLGILAIVNHVLAFSQTENYNPFVKGLHISNAIGSTLILGSVLGAMITGHWYLVKHKLSLKPLINGSKVYIFSVFLRIFIIIFTTFSFWKIDKSENLIKLSSGFTLEGIFFIARVTIGLIIPLIFGFMVWGTVKIRSTQSATGILYATFILVLIGEVFANVFSRLIGIPL